MVNSFHDGGGDGVGDDEGGEDEGWMKINLKNYRVLVLHYMAVFLEKLFGKSFPPLLFAYDTHILSK